MRKITEIIIHCSATKEGVLYRAKDIDEWHRKLGWKGIGYHYVINIDGLIEIGRKEVEIGAHCYGHNENSIGVCYIGGLDKEGKPKDTRTNMQKASMINLLKGLKRAFPDAKIIGHRDTGAQKECPCFDAITEYKYL